MSLERNTLGPVQNEQTARCRWVLVVTEFFDIAGNDFDAQESARCKRVLVVTELVVSGTQYILATFFLYSITETFSTDLLLKLFTNESYQTYKLEVLN